MSETNPSAVDPFYTEGQEAFADGADRADCPYAEGTDGQCGWMKGYADALRDSPPSGAVSAKSNSQFLSIQAACKYRSPTTSQMNQCYHPGLPHRAECCAILCPVLELPKAGGK